MKKKLLKLCMPVIIFLLAFIGIAALKKENEYTEKDNESDEIILKESDFWGGLWHTDKYSYKYKLNLTGKLPKADEDIVFVVLSNFDLLTFDDVANSIFDKKNELDEKEFALVEIKKN